MRREKIKQFENIVDYCKKEKVILFLIFCAQDREFSNLSCSAAIQRYYNAGKLKRDHEAETPNNFCLSRFSQVCPDFPLLKNANLQSVSRFTVLDLLDTFSVQICVLEKRKMWTHLRKSTRTEIV